jgi:hypothetical protein
MTDELPKEIWDQIVLGPRLIEDGEDFIRRIALLAYRAALESVSAGGKWMPEEADRAMVIAGNESAKKGLNMMRMYRAMYAAYRREDQPNAAEQASPSVAPGDSESGSALGPAPAAPTPNLERELSEARAECERLREKINNGWAVIWRDLVLAGRAKEAEEHLPKD